MKLAEIENKAQYKEYCNRHLELGNILSNGLNNEEMENEYYIIDLIIEDYHKKQKNPFDGLTPVDLLKALMKENGYSGYNLSKELNMSQSVISDITHYKRGFSKDLIRKLGHKFGIGGQSFLKEYELIGRESNVA